MFYASVSIAQSGLIKESIHEAPETEALDGSEIVDTDNDNSDAINAESTSTNTAVVLEEPPVLLPVPTEDDPLYVSDPLMIDNKLIPTYNSGDSIPYKSDVKITPKENRLHSD